MNGWSEEQLAIYNAMRDDLRGVRSDVVESLEAARTTSALEARDERERLAQVRMEDRTEFARFVQESRDFQRVALRYIKAAERPVVPGAQPPMLVPFFRSPIARLILRVAEASGAPLGTTRLVLATALMLSLLMASMTACIVQVR